VLTFAPAAARRAAELGAHREAAAQYARALRFADAAPPVDRARLLEAYSSECSDTSQLEEAIRVLREAVELWRVVGDRLREGESLTRLARPLVWAGHNAEGEAASRASLALLETLPPGPELAFACTIQAGLRTHKHDDAEAIAWGGRAIALAEQVGATETLVHALKIGRLTSAMASSRSWSFKVFRAGSSAATRRRMS
jgi:tetratricopeptide (TPR) repeat protein